jgi:hypothetical protein
MQAYSNKSLLQHSVRARVRAPFDTVLMAGVIVIVRLHFEPLTPLVLKIFLLKPVGP